MQNIQISLYISKQKKDTVIFITVSQLSNYTCSSSSASGAGSTLALASLAAFLLSLAV